MPLALIRFVPTASGSEGVDLSWPDGDKTLVQVDLASISPQNAAMEIMTVYRFLLMLEKQKKLTKYELSYTTCTRASSADASLSDGFKIEVSEPHRFKTIPDLEKALTCKSFFHDLAKSVAESPAAVTVFRWRYERVHAQMKVQKPYVATKIAFKLDPGKPVALSKTD